MVKYIVYYIAKFYHSMLPHLNLFKKCTFFYPDKWVRCYFYSPIDHMNYLTDERNTICTLSKKKFKFTFNLLPLYNDVFYQLCHLLTYHDTFIYIWWSNFFFLQEMNLTFIILTNDCPVSVDPLKILTYLWLIQAEKICCEKIPTDSTVLSGSLSQNIVCLKDALAFSASINGW